MQEIFELMGKFIATVGFPVFVAVYLLGFLRETMIQLTKAIQSLENSIVAMREVIRKCEK